MMIVLKVLLLKTIWKSIVSLSMIEMNGAILSLIKRNQNWRQMREKIPFYQIKLKVELRSKCLAL